MADIRKSLLAQFKGTHLYSNFGPAIRSMTINGFRGLNDVHLDFEYPITAISGTNGSGKSTIAQLAVCGYKVPQTEKKHKRRYVKDFFPVSPLDPAPFNPDASVKFQYATNTNFLQDLTVSRQVTEWSGYKRQPERHVFYVGFALYIPKVERKDLSIYKPDAFTLGEKRQIPAEIRAHVSAILNNQYDDVSFQEIAHKERNIELGVVAKYGYSYSENNMGFGEGRLLYMINLLENEPNNSFFALEEPETSLHEDAQYKFIKYLMDVCNRKKHQIILSTHSSIILEALPPEGRKFIIRNQQGVKVLDRLSGSRAKAILTYGTQKALIVCVEDDFAKLLLTEVIRRLHESYPLLLPSLQIAAMGDKKAVANSVNTLLSSNVKAIGVRDADTGEDTSRKLYKLPGTQPPEKEVFEKQEVKAAINAQYHIDIDTILAGHIEVDHHRYGDILSESAICSEEQMNLFAISSYIDHVGIDLFKPLVETINKEA